MNEAQRLWWRQAESDHKLFSSLLSADVPECHLLHYLQMATEKLSKAYLWRTGKAPPKSHTGFIRFLKAIIARPPAELDRIASVFGFARRGDLIRSVKEMLRMAYEVQNLAPAEAGDGPNPEYPWPHEAPDHCPVGHTFHLWDRLRKTGQGRVLMVFVKHAVERFEYYA